jgi:hypothetical protein
MSKGFTVGNWNDPLKFYAAVPLSGNKNKVVIIHNGQQLKVCRNEQSARNFIDRHKKSKSVGELPF